MCEFARFIVALAIFPLIVLDELLHRDEFARFEAEQRQRLADLAEGT